MTQLDRGLSTRVAALREALVRLEALLVHHIDFPEEDEPPVPLDRIIDATGDILPDIDELLATAPGGELLREGALVVLAGRPNAGKSSLYNALVGEERAIVTDEPGTTRDALIASVELGGFPFRLVDTAGLREAGEPVERIGIEVTRRFLERADVVLLCVPTGARETSAEVDFLDRTRGVPVVWLDTKADLAESASAPDEVPQAAHRLLVSARTGEGLDELSALLARLMYGGIVTASADVPVLTRERHRRSLQSARTEVEAFAAALAAGLPAEVASSHLRAAESALEDLLGAISTEAVLDVVFAEFCIGK
jgi:tRNA modification GTPase